MFVHYIYYIIYVCVGMCNKIIKQTGQSHEFEREWDIEKGEETEEKMK